MTKIKKYDEECFLDSRVSVEMDMMMIEYLTYVRSLIHTVSCGEFDEEDNQSKYFTLRLAERLLEFESE